jgi:hypothetical protein
MTFCPPIQRPPWWRLRARLKHRRRLKAMGDFSSYLMPVIHAPIPRAPLLDLFSPPTKPARSATTIYWNWVVGRRPWWKRLLSRFVR